MGWLDRLGQAVRAQVNSLMREDPDPEQLLEEAVMAMEQELIQMRQALAETIATQKRTEREIHKHQQAAQTWHERAQLALSKGNETLARDALLKWQMYQNQCQPFQKQLEQQSPFINRLKQELRELEHKYSEAKTKKSLYLARLRSAVAAQKMQEITGNFHPYSTANLFEQVENQIRELEAHAELRENALSDPLERQFAALEGQNKAEAELLNLKIQSITSNSSKPSPSSQNTVDLEIEKLRAELDQI